MPIKSGPVGIDRHGGRHCWCCGAMKFAPYEQVDLICWGCRAVNTTADPEPSRPTPVLPAVPRRRGLSAIGDLGGLLP
ncbi:hypothetical protein [Tsukamurella pseudospumae]|uniref:Cysteine-rich CPCC domain-containing protein n=1 Tax=Tsukamurella pseudospumae TaxID=239498 RepID=A0A137YX96_9ACTN|nr:hypothetical protein [Tsukamurella pseudospumae]KXO90575.1 hypothetical protein AXK61_08190 [Tsukamurella pseudospumae]